MIEQNGHDQHERFPLLDAEWESVAAALPLFLAGANKQLQEVCKALATFLNFTGRWDERLSLCLQAETKAVAARDMDQAGARAYQAGWIHCSRGQGDEVLACAGRAAAHWEHSEARARERIAAMRLGAHGYRLKKDYPAALEAFTHTLELDRSRSPDSRDVLVGLNDLAMVEYLLGHYEAAERSYRDALPLAEAHGDNEGVALIKSGLAGLALKRGDRLTAFTLASEALQLSSKVERQDLTASACNVMADILLSSGDPVKALSHALKAVEIYTRLGSPDLKDALDTLHECEKAMGER
jgi:tetratricopeptide (TPR) repeat protein